MKDKQQSTGSERLVDFLIQLLSTGILILGIVMVVITWEGMEGPALSAVGLLLVGAVLFAGHNFCLYLDDSAKDVTQGLDDVRQAIASLEETLRKAKDDSAGKP